MSTELLRGSWTYTTNRISPFSFLPYCSSTCYCCLFSTLFQSLLLPRPQADPLWLSSLLYVGNIQVGCPKCKLHQGPSFFKPSSVFPFHQPFHCGSQKPPPTHLLSPHLPQYFLINSSCSTNILACICSLIFKKK